MFDIVKRAHVATGHGGRDKMMKELSSKYANITIDVLDIFKSLCLQCMKKRKRHGVKGVVVRPLITKDFGSRGQVDLVDMQSLPNGQYKWIMVYQDHLTKFCILRPLTSKRAAKVAHQLMDIFLIFGAPHILQSDNGAEFTSHVVSELTQMWPDLLIVHGKPRHPQSQGSVERLNCDVKDMLIAWLGDNHSTDWPLGLKFVQFSKNISYHSRIQQTPYKALFGVSPRVGLRSTDLPTEILERMSCEEDLFAAVSSSTTSSATVDQDVIPSTSSTTSSSATVDHQDVIPSASTTSSSATVDHQDVIPSASTTSSSTIAVQQDVTPDNIKTSRQRATQAMMSQAERMVKRSRVKFVPGNPGDNVTVPVSLVDRGRSDPRNLLGIILDRDENDLYRIAVRAGILKGKYSRNQFELCVQKLL